MSSPIVIAPPSLPSPPPRPETPFLYRLTATAMGLLIFTLGVWLLKEFAVILQQLLMAMFMAYLIMPLHQWLVRHRASSLFAFALIGLLFLTGALVFGQMAYENVSEIRENVPTYRVHYNSLGTRILENVPAQYHDHVRTGLGLDKPGEASKEIPSVDKDVAKAVPLPDKSADQSRINASLERVQGILGSFAGFLAEVVIVLIFLFFMLSERIDTSLRIEHAFGPERGRELREIIKRINHAIAAYISVKTFTSALIGIGVAITLYCFGVKFAFFFGLLAFVSNFVPYVGLWLAVLPPTTLMLLDTENFGLTGLALVVQLLIHNGVAYLIEPRMAGDRVNLSPLIIVVSLAFWASIWGVGGMVLAIPLMVVIRTILANIQETKPIAELLSQRPEGELLGDVRANDLPPEEHRKAVQGKV